jgi:hypothetical protein
MLELNKWELIEAIKKRLSEDFNLVQIVNGEYKGRNRYRINLVGEGKLDVEYIPNPTADDREWDAYFLLKLRYEMSNIEVDNWERPQPTEAKALRPRLSDPQGQGGKDVRTK